MDVYQHVSNFLNIYMQNRQCAHPQKISVEKDTALISFTGLPSDLLFKLLYHLCNC